MSEKNLNASNATNNAIDTTISADNHDTGNKPRLLPSRYYLCDIYRNEATDRMEAITDAIMTIQLDGSCYSPINRAICFKDLNMISIIEMPLDENFRAMEPISTAYGRYKSSPGMERQLMDIAREYIGCQFADPYGKIWLENRPRGWTPILTIK